MTGMFTSFSWGCSLQGCSLVIKIQSYGSLSRFFLGSFVFIKIPGVFTFTLGKWDFNLSTSLNWLWTIWVTLNHYWLAVLFLQTILHVYTKNRLDAKDIEYTKITRSRQIIFGASNQSFSWLMIIFRESHTWHTHCILLNTTVWPGRQPVISWVCAAVVREKSGWVIVCKNVCNCLLQRDVDIWHTM
jgi:hypothetical protein